MIKRHPTPPPGTWKIPFFLINIIIPSPNNEVYWFLSLDLLKDLLVLPQIPFPIQKSLKKLFACLLPWCREGNGMVFRSLWVKTICHTFTYTCITQTLVLEKNICRLVTLMQRRDSHVLWVFVSQNCLLTQATQTSTPIDLERILRRNSTAMRIHYFSKNFFKYGIPRKILGVFSVNCFNFRT